MQNSLLYANIKYINHVFLFSHIIDINQYQTERMNEKLTADHGIRDVQLGFKRFIFKSG